MYKNIFLKSLFLALIINSILSCDNDFNELGSDIIGANNFETGTPETYAVKAETKDLGPVETLDLPVNALGIYNNPVFGVTKANLAIQLQMNLNSLNPTFDPALNPTIESVVLKIPYFSTKGTTNSDGSSLYTLDSVYGPLASKIKLKIFESGYYIRDLDPNPAVGVQKYYSNQNQEFDQAKGIQLNDDTSDLRQNDEFVFSPAEQVEPGVITDEIPNPDPIRTAPGMKLYLNKDYFKSKIFLAPAGKLVNNNVFKEYMRGLYFQVENTGGDEGNLAMLDIKKGTIAINYKQDETTTEIVDGETITTTKRVDKTYTLYLNGKSVGLFENQSTLVQNPNNIYLRGGQGSMAVIDLFGPDTDLNGTADKLEELRANKWLVNDASLTFNIDNAAMGSSGEEPNRIYLYDLKNKRPLVDFYTDQNTPSTAVNQSKSLFGGIIKKTGTRGTSYKIRLTNHIRGLLNNADSTNVKLGLVVMQNINEIGNKKLKTAVPTGLGAHDFNITEIPFSSIVNPFGTILYGSGLPVGDPNYDKRIQLKIYYTKPKQN